MDLNKLKELAEAAYKGEWVAVGESGAIHMGDRFDKYQAMMPNTWTARYVVAAKPAAVLELIAVNEALESALAQSRAEAEAAKKSLAAELEVRASNLRHIDVLNADLEKLRGMVRWIPVSEYLNSGWMQIRQTATHVLAMKDYPPHPSPANQSHQAATQDPAPGVGEAP